MRFNAESNATEDLRGGMGWETRENAPKNGGRPEGTRPERLRYGAATKNQRVAERFPERKANATRSWMDGAGIGSLGGVRRKQRTRRISQSRQPPHSLRRRRVLLAVVYRFVFLGGADRDAGFGQRLAVGQAGIGALVGEPSADSDMRSMPVTFLPYMFFSATCITPCLLYTSPSPRD